MIPDFSQDEGKETHRVRVNLTHLDVQGVVRLCEMFPTRYITAMMNNYYLMTISAVTYEEFAQIVAIYGTYNRTGKMHLVFKPAPHVRYHITSEQGK